MTNIIKTRIKNKIKKLEEWKLSNPVLLNGEIAIVIDGNLTRIKTGNGISAFNDLPYVSNTQHITYENYAQLLKNGNIDPQMVYILSNDYVDCFGEQIKNLAPGTDLSDAVNVEQLNDAISSINIPEIPTKISEFENDAKYANISVDGEIITDFKVEHITQDDYHNLVTSENGIDSKTLYIVSSDTLNMYGEKIINVLSGENDNDATNVSQVKSYVNELKIDLDENINIVNELLEKKIYIDGQYSDLSILRIDADTYHNLVSNNQVNKDILYIVSSDNTNAYGERIENVATPLSAGDAVNKEYVDVLSTNLKETIDNIEIPKNISQLSNDIKFSKVIVDSENTEEFKVKHVSQDEYHELVNSTDGIDKDTLYVISSDTLNMYGEQIKNLAPGVDLSDAVNVEQLNEAISSIDIPTIPTKVSEFENDANYVNISVDGQITDNFKVEHITQDDYHNLVNSKEGPDKDTLYIVSADTLNLYGERIENLASPISASDAANKEYVDILSADLTEKIDNIEIPKNISQLSNDIRLSKVLVDNENTEEFNVKHISQDEYHEIINSNEGPNKDTLYVVSSDSLNLYGEQIKNLAPGVDLSDAVNVEQLCSAISSIYIPEIPSKVSEFENDANYVNISVDGAITTDFKVEHIAQDKYHELVNSEDGPDKNTLYIISSDTLNMYGEKIINVLSGTEETDAATVGQINKLSNDLISEINKIEIPVNVSQLSNDTGFITAKVNDIQVNSLEVKNITSKDYHDLVVAGNVLSNTLYVVSSDTLNMYGERIENIAAPLSANDAVNKEYVDQKCSGYKLIAAEPTGEYPNVTYVIENQTITTINLDDENLNVTIQLPENKNNGYARDFILRLNITAMPQIIWSGIDESWDVESDDEDWLNLEIGSNVISFTELA